MAARKRKGTKDSPWPKQSRERMSVNMLLKMVTACALGEQKVSDKRLRAAFAVIDRHVPDAGVAPKKKRGEYDRKAAGLTGPRPKPETEPTGS